MRPLFFFGNNQAAKKNDILDIQLLRLKFREFQSPQTDTMIALRYIVVSFIVLVFPEGITQTNVTLDDLRLAAGVKLTGEYQVKHGLKFRLSATAGVAHYIPVFNNDVGVLPTAHIGVLFYNKGMLGSNLNTNYYRTIFFDFFANATITGGYNNIVEISELNNRRVPLHHFADFTANPLQNTFDYSISFGSNWLMNPDKNRASQTVGFFNLNVARYVQLAYYNDGGPVLDYLGDKEDRYYTGGLTLTVHFENKYHVNAIALSFHKFTGWQQYAVDAADKLQLDHIPYKNKDAFGFNQQQWTLRMLSFRQGYAAYVTFYDINALDVQDFIHATTDFPYHPDYFYGWRFAAGGGSEIQNKQ